MRGNAAFEHNTIDAIIKSANHGNIAPIDNLSDIIMSYSGHKLHELTLLSSQTVQLVYVI